MSESPYNAIVCRYAEIALKGGNRGHFEKLFVQGIRRALKMGEDLKIDRERGRVLLHLRKYAPFSSEQLAHIHDRLGHAFGLASYSPGIVTKSTLDAIESVIDSTFEDHLTARIAGRASISYRMRARRNLKTFPLSSNQIEVHFADQLLPKYPQLQLDLENAELTIGVEVRRDWSFIFFDEIPGPGGLPSGSASPALAMLSGGIDSAVACYQLMKRGCSLHFLTFHSAPYTPPESVDKVRRLVQLLNGYQRKGRFFACNMVNAQKAVRDNCTEKFRTILYRRIMVRVGTLLAQKFASEALITGDSVGQVASQTVRNISVINDACPMLILRPLIGTDKEDIVRTARALGTFETSEVQCADSCTVFAPGSPTTGAKLAFIKSDEAELDMATLIRDCIDNTISIDPATGMEYALEFEFTDEDIQSVINSQ
jgi:thiamine biosynthesis protein ThiI